MTLLVTGVAGFIGSNFVYYYLANILRERLSVWTTSPTLEI